MIIYKVTNLINGKVYIGKDTKNRLTYLGSGKILKRAVNKYGKENFQKETLETCNNEIELNEREKYWISKINTKVPNGYNLADGGDGGNIWKTLSPERQQKIIENSRRVHSGHERSEATKLKLKIANTGHIVSDKARYKIGKATRQRKAWLVLHDPIIKAKSAESLKIKFTPEQIQSIIEAYNNYADLVDIGQQYNVSIQPIKRILKEHKVPKRKYLHLKLRKQFTQIEQNKIVELYNGQEQIDKIAQAIRTTGVKVSSFLKEKGLFVRRVDHLFKKGIKRKIEQDCRMKDCSGKYKALGFCTKHYQQYRAGVISMEGHRLKELKWFGCGYKEKENGEEKFA